MIKTPSEASLLGHLLWLREFLSKAIISNLLWVDTRDMVADGLTKGSVGRTQIQQAAQGVRCRTHTPYAVSLTQAGALTVHRGSERQPGAANP